MTLTLGQRMVRLSDGMKGVVQQNGPELRIAYLDRGEELMAAKSEKWAVDELKPGPMLYTERLLIALHADRALRCLERHEPMKWWDSLDSGDVYDPALVSLIIVYLERRETRTAV